MSLLGGLLDKAKSWLGAAPTPVEGLSEHAVRQTRFDTATYNEMLNEAPDLKHLVNDLAQNYDYTHDLVGDTFAQLYQSAPMLRQRTEMKEGWLANHAVAQNVANAPETETLRAYAKHNKYGATMATIGISDKVKTYLAENKELADAAKAAEQARQEAAQQDQQVQDQAQQAQAQQQGLDQSMKDLQDAAAALADTQAALDGAMGDFDGNGPLTEAQAQAQEAAQAAAEGFGQAQGTADQAGQAAALTAEVLADLLKQAEAARQAADAAGDQVQAAADKAQRALRTPVLQAVKEAADALEAEEEMFRAWGVDEGELERMSFAERQERARQLSGHRLAEFTKMLGRWKMMQKAQFAHNVTHARDEVYDIELTGNLHDVLPAEFAHLGTKPGTIEFLVRMDERQLLGRKYRGTEQSGQGAIIACCDTSGSMKQTDKHGVPRDVFSKGFLLALMEQARVEKRDFVAIIFANASKQKVFHFPNGQATLDQALECTELFFNGGTDFQKPLDLAIDLLEKQFNNERKGKGDIVLITDDDCAVSPEWLTQYKAKRARLNFRTFGVAVGMPRAGGTLASLSDDVRAVQEFHNPAVVADIIRTV